MNIMSKALIVTGGVVVLIGLLILSGVILIDSGKLQTQQENLSDFTIINIQSGFHTQISQGNSFNVSITADSNVINRINVNQTGNTLTIGLQLASIFNIGTLKAQITMPDLQEIHLSGGANANVSGFVMAHDLIVSESGGSTLRVEGQANGLSASCSGGSGLQLSGFKVDTATIIMSGGSTGNVNVNGRLDADLSGGSSLVYGGNPTLGTIITSGLSTITQQP
jgi:hypothetical protein